MLPFYHFCDIFQFKLLNNNLMQTEKNRVEVNRSRVEIKADFSKDLKNLNDPELNTAVNNFRRYKVMQMDKLREGSPLFGMAPTNHSFNREKVLRLLKDIINGADISQKSRDDDYSEALNIIDWYNKGKEQYLKESKAKEFTAKQ